MEEKVRLNVYGRPIIAVLTIGSRNANRFSFTGGQIHMRVKKNYSIDKISKTVEKALKKSAVEKFNTDDYIGEDYIDLLGKRRRLVILNEHQEIQRMEDVVFKKRENINQELKKLALDIYTKEIRKYEKIMNIPISHEVKVTKMSSALGKNYYTKKLITLDISLIHYSLELIDSVVVHELCHYYYHDHSRKFYNLLLGYFPNYMEAKKKLTFGERS